MNRDRTEGKLDLGSAPLSDWTARVEGGGSVVIRADDPNRTYVGSSDACALSLADSFVSRRHLALSVTPRGLRIEDLGSRNGTRVSGLEIRDAYLTEAAAITVGETRLVVERSSSTRGEAPLGAVRFGNIVGASPAMRRLYPLLDCLARSDVPVLVEGETGAGKELVAESLHASGPRAKGPFVVLDCTTVAATLLESTLFGHEKGAFTGATTDKPGVFERADGGTLFIDEIGDLAIELQAKLLRCIQSGQVQRVGGTRWIRTNVRIVSATRRDLEAEIQAGRFRDDLFYRLVVARVELPPLRERREDIPILARMFWRAFGGDERAFPADILVGREAYAWPGNVRELHNKIARRLALGDLAGGAPSSRSAPNAATSKPAKPEDFLDALVRQKQSFALARERAILEFERRFVEHALEEHDGNVTRAAESSGIGRRYFYKIRSRVT